MGKAGDTMAILKLYELRRNKQMRKARQWYFSEFAPESAMDIVALYRGGERTSANFRMVASYWDTACSLVLNDGIDRKLFLDANTEHVFVYAKIADYLPEVREIFREPDFRFGNPVRRLPRHLFRAERRKMRVVVRTVRVIRMFFWAQN